MTKVDITKIDRDFFCFRRLGSKLVDIIGHNYTLHLPSVWMVYGCRQCPFKGVARLGRRTGSAAFAVTAMSEVGRKSGDAILTSVLPSTADIRQHGGHFREVPMRSSRERHAPITQATATHTPLGRA